MSSKEKQTNKAEPMIRFGGEWVPAHDLWKKMETANVVTDAIEHFNDNFPYLSSPDTRDVVPLVRQRLKDIDLRMPGKYTRPDLTPVAHRLLESMSPEDTIATLHDKYGIQVDIAQLIQLAGEDAYVAALSREAHEFALNLISPEQTADLWNDALRPAPAGGLWTATKVQSLLEQAH